MKFKMDYKEFLIKNKKVKHRSRIFICNDGIFNPLKVKNIRIFRF